MTGSSGTVKTVHFLWFWWLQRFENVGMKDKGKSPNKLKVLHY
ncbi:hypothetical protein Hdeb2414_s0006g00190951 [Helianthus debilis subsp. tardiflorus]